MRTVDAYAAVPTGTAIQRAELYDTTNGAKLIAAGGSGRGLTAVDENIYAALLSKANEQNGS